MSKRRPKIPNQIIINTIDGRSQAPGTGKSSPNSRAAGVLFAVWSDVIERVVTSDNNRIWSIQEFQEIGDKSPSRDENVSQLIMRRHIQLLLRLRNQYQREMVSTCRKDTDVYSKQQGHEGAILGSSNAASKGSCGGEDSRESGSRCARSSGRRLVFEV